jgi:hypothetical protein
VNGEEAIAVGWELSSQNDHQIRRIFGVVNRNPGWLVDDDNVIVFKKNRDLVRHSTKP